MAWMISLGVLACALSSPAPQGATCQPGWIPTFGGQPGTSNDVRALAVFDDGSGPALSVGGAFGTAGGLAAARIARWDGSKWSALGSGVEGNVVSLTVFDGGGTSALYAGGSFTAAGGVLARNIARISCTSCAGNCRRFQLNFNQVIQSGEDPLLTTGQRVNIQVRQRDPGDPAGLGDNLSNGLSFVVGS
jgi:hypothetical protein